IENEYDNTQNDKMIDILLKYGAEERSGLDVYIDIFKLGQNYIQTSDETVDNNNLKTNPILVMKDEGSAVRRRIMFEDQFEDLLFEAQKSDFRSEEHTSELQSRFDLVCRLLLEKK